MTRIVPTWWQGSLDGRIGTFDFFDANGGTKPPPGDMMPNVRIAYSRETPSSWKGSVTITTGLFPTSVSYLAGANFAEILSTSDMEFRERRLVVSILPGALQSISYPGAGGNSMPGPCLGSYLNIGTDTSLVGSVANDYNLGIRVTCTGHAQSILQCDARQGVYRIPPCTSVQVQAMLSRVYNNGNSVVPFSIRAELSDSCEGPVLRPTETTKINFEATNADFDVWLNTLTRWVDLQAYSFGADPIGSASAPIVTAASLVGPTIYKNYVSQNWFPSSEPVDLGGGVSNQCDASPGKYTIKSTGTAQTYATFTQFLEW